MICALKPNKESDQCMFFFNWPFCTTETINWAFEIQISDPNYILCFLVVSNFFSRSIYTRKLLNSIDLDSRKISKTYPKIMKVIANPKKSELHT